MYLRERIGYSLPGGEHGSQRGECGSVFLQGFELIPQFHHGLGYHGFFVLVLALQIGQSHFSCLSAEERGMTGSERGGISSEESDGVAQVNKEEPLTALESRLEKNPECGCSCFLFQRMWFTDFCVCGHRENHTHSLKV